MKQFIFIITLLFTYLNVAQDSTKYSNSDSISGYYKVSKVRIFVNDMTEIQELRKQGVRFERVKMERGYFDTFLDSLQIENLKNTGYQHHVIIDDVTKDYLERTKESRDKIKKLKKKGETPCGKGSFGYGSMGGFYTFDEVVAELDAMHQLYPTLITAKDSVGSSIEGRAIWTVKISDNPNTNEEEPEVFYNSLIHAREPNSMMTVIRFMYYLLENYGSDPEVTYLVDNREFYFMPVINPDGYVFNENMSPNGGGFWRKNRRDNGNGIFGVDLNRNFGYMWGYDNEGSSSNPNYIDYRGTGPFSEPETQTIREFCADHNFSVSANYHTYWNVVFTPWGYNLEQSIDSIIFNRLVDNATVFNNYINGFDLSPYENYPSNGDVLDWMYGETTEKNKIFGVLPEVGGDADGHWPEPARILELTEENIYSNLVYAWGPGIIENPPYIELANISKNYLPSSSDTISILAKDYNPNSLESTVISIITDDFGDTVDTIEMTRGTDSFLRGNWAPGNDDEKFYSILLKQTGVDKPSNFYFKDQQNLVFTTAGPVKLNSWEVSQINDLNILRISNISAVNQGLTKTIDNVIVRFYTEDTSVTKISGIMNLSSLLPQEIKIASGSIYVEVDKLKDYTFIAEISSDNVVYWKDTIEFRPPNRSYYVPTDFAQIQDAIEIAENGDSVIIEEGTYYQQFNFIGKAITVGSEFLIDTITSHISKTIIDGSFFVNQDTASIVSFISREDTNSVLCGLTLQNGSGTYGKGDGYNWRTGGAIILSSSGATIKNNIFKNNSITKPALTYVTGGGIDCFNLPEDKGLIIENNKFHENKVEGKNSWGGAINCENSSGRVRIEKNIVIKNSVNGTSQGNGGGISVVVGNNNKIAVSNNYVNKNIVNGGADDGGGIFAMNCKIDILNNIITENSCYGTSKGSGGGISVGNWDAVNPSQSIANITNNTIIDNNAQNTGSGIVVNSMAASIMNNIIRNNSDPTETQLNILGSYEKKVEYSNIEGGFEGEGNIDSDPMFCDSNYCILTKNISPCIDAGNPDSKYYDLSKGISRTAAYPAYGLLFNDMGAFGGPHSKWAEMSILPADPVTSVKGNFDIIPVEYSLEQNYPNPFNPSTTIKYSIPRSSVNSNPQRDERSQNIDLEISPSGRNDITNVSLKIYDILGSEVATLVNENQKPGNYEVDFNAHRLSSGIYFYKLHAGDFVKTKKMILLK